MECHNILRAPMVKPHHKALLRAFVSQAVWSNHRLYDLGYDVEAVEVTCPRCGGTTDSLHHRLF